MVLDGCACDRISSALALCDIRADVGDLLGQSCGKPSISLDDRTEGAINLGFSSKG